VFFIFWFLCFVLLYLCICSGCVIVICAVEPARYKMTVNFN
jgi:hypothetical protein